MNEIKSMLTGKIKMRTFLAELKSDRTLQLQLNSLIPIEAINNKTHIFWECISFDALEKYNFDLYQMLVQMFKFNDSLADNLNIFCTIQHIYCYSYPATICTAIYNDMFSLYLATVKDCFDGPEVRTRVYEILQEAYALKTPRGRIKKARKEIRDFFHQENSKRPHWIQGPEWPMGTSSPMKFLKQSSFGEFVQYTFIDVDTGVEKTIEQFY